MMSNLRAGLIGLGMMGRNHARVLASLDGVDLVAVADAAGDRFGAAAGRPVLENIDQLLDAGLDYVVVAAPTAFHEELGAKIADAGVNALIEKPLAHSIEAVRLLRDTFQAKGLVAGVGHIERYNASLQEARRRIDEGQLGQIYQISTRRQGPFPGRISDVGVVLDLASHDIDLTAWVAESPFVEVSARAAYRSGRVHEDMVVVNGTLENGVITNHLVNWLTPFKERQTTITGELGVFVADTLTGDLTFYENGTVPTEESMSRFRGVAEGHVIRYAFPKIEPLRREHENFRDAVMGKPADIVTLEQGCRVVEVCSAIIDSVKHQNSVTL